MLIGNLAGTPGAVAELHAGSLETVGSTLRIFNAFNVPTAGPGIVTLTPSLPIALAANTTYWLVLGTIGSGSFVWSYAQGG